jgi:hypothetical protein
MCYCLAVVTHIPTFESETHLRRVLAVLLTRLGHKHVQITHGPLERGKDIIFSIADGFGLLQYCACVVKNTPISADHTKANRLEPVLGQIRQAFGSPFLDADGKEAYVTKVFLVCPHEISQLTLELIKAPLGDFGPRLSIIDGPRLFTLIQDHYPDYKVDEFSTTRDRLAAFRTQVRHDEPLERLTRNSLQIDVDRNAHQIYVQPTFEVMIREWVLQPEYLSDLTPEVMAMVHIRPGRTDPRPPGVAFRVSYVSQAHLASVRRASESYSSKVRQFVHLGLLSPGTHEDLRQAYIVTEEIISAALARQTDVRWRDLNVKHPGCFIAPPTPFSELTEEDSTKLEAQKQRISARLAAGTSEINSLLGTPLRMSVSDSNIENLLGTDAFQRAIYLSDYFHFAPHRDVFEGNTKRIQVDRRVFHNRGISTLIVGQAGFGKTSFCRWHTLEDDKLFSQKAHGWVSVYIPLHKLDPQAFVDLAGTVAEHARQTSQYFGRVDQQREGYRIYLDGLDEVVEENARAKVLSLLRKNPPIDGPVAYVVTSRDYLVGQGTLGIRRLGLSLLSRDQVERLIRLWLGDETIARSLLRQLSELPALAELARIPLLGTLIILVFRRTRSLPTSRLQLYEAFVGLLCSGWDLAKGVQRAAHYKAEFKVLILRRLAYLVHRARRRTFNAVDLNRAIEELEIQSKDGDLSSLLDELLADGVVHSVGNDLEFRHLSFQEYLAAVDIFHDPRRGKAGAFLAEYLRGDNWYREALQFFLLSVKDSVAGEQWIDEECDARGIRRSNRVRERMHVLQRAAKQGVAGL